MGLLAAVRKSIAFSYLYVALRAPRREPYVREAPQFATRGSEPPQKVPFWAREKVKRGMASWLRSSASQKFWAGRMLYMAYA